VREPRSSPRRGARSHCFHCRYSAGRHSRCHALDLTPELAAPWQQLSGCSGGTGMPRECHPSSAECPVTSRNSFSFFQTHCNIQSSLSSMKIFQVRTKIDHLQKDPLNKLQRHASLGGSCYFPMQNVAVHPMVFSIEYFSIISQDNTFYLQILFSKQCLYVYYCFGFI
jgi:hypothetical protein